MYFVPDNCKFKNMKYFVKLIAAIPLFFVFFFQTGLTSCTKDPINPTDTVTIIKHDTVTIIHQDTALTASILTSHPWKVLEERGVAGNNIIYYYRGGTSNTQSFDNEFITFNANGTGVHTQQNGIQTNITWTLSGNGTKLTWTLLNTPATYTITWDNIRYKNGNMYFDQYYTDGNTGINSHSQQIRMPK
jgi:hypothetical protein